MQLISAQLAGNALAWFFDTWDSSRWNGLLKKAVC